MKFEEPETKSEAPGTQNGSFEDNLESPKLNLKNQILKVTKFEDIGARNCLCMNFEEPDTKFEEPGTQK